MSLDGAPICVHAWSHICKGRECFPLQVPWLQEKVLTMTVMTVSTWWNECNCQMMTEAVAESSKSDLRGKTPWSRRPLGVLLSVSTIAVWYLL